MARRMREPVKGLPLVTRTSIREYTRSIGENKSVYTEKKGGKNGTKCALIDGLRTSSEQRVRNMNLLC